MTNRSRVPVALIAVMAGCTGRGSQGTQGVPSQTIEQVLSAYNDSLMAIPGVVGTAIGLCDGAPCVRVFLADSSAATRDNIPRRLGGYLVQTEVTGPIRPRGSDS